MAGTTMTAHEARQQLYGIVRRDAPFDEKAEEALELGKQYLNADNGHLTRIDQETDHWEAIVSTDEADEPFPPGLELDLGTTYCRRTLTEDAPIALHDAPTQSWADDPAFQTHGLHCYHGTTLIVNGEPFGTVCFVAEDPRGEPFSDGETMFAELITRMLERELEREQHEADLVRQTNLATVLNRVLRHNLRNDMSVIRGFTQLMADRLENDRYSNTALSCIDKVIALSEKARELDRFVAADFEREPAEIVALVEELIEGVEADYPEASIALDYDEEITATVFPSFTRAIEELIENAAKHGGDTPHIGVSIESVPNAVEIQISDDGPGLADHEADVLKTGAETPLTHGTGLGLWLSHWIISSHGGSLDVTKNGTGTKMKISIPRMQSPNVTEELRRVGRARDLYQAAFEEATDGMLLVNTDARIIDANTEASITLGIERRQLLGRSLPEVLPDDLDFQNTWKSIKQREHSHETLVLDEPNGNKRYISYSVATDIVPGRHLIIGRDISEQISSKVEVDTVIENLPGYVYRHKLADGWPLEFVKGSARDVTGYTTAELEEEITFAEEVIHPDDREKVTTGVQEEIAETDHFDLTYRIITKDGDQRWVRDQGKLIEDPITGGEYLDGFIMDVTQQTEREQTLHVMSQRLEAILENTTTPMCMKDDDGKYVFVNRAYRELFGLQDEEIIGHTDGELHPPGMADEVWANDQAVLEHARPIEREEHIDVNGDERVYLSTKVPIYDTGDRSDPDTPVAVFGVATDITERKEYEDRLQKEQRFVRSIFRSLPDPFYAFDTDGYLIRWNEELESQLGYSSDELDGMYVTELVPEDEVTRIKTKFQQILEKRQSVVVESAFETKDGARIPYEFTGGPLEDANGTVEGVTGIGRDISERKEREGQLEALNQTTQELMAATSRMEVTEIGVEKASSIFGLETNSIYLYSEEEDGLVPVAATDNVRDLVEELPVLTETNSIAWQAYKDDEARIIDDVRYHPMVHNPETDVRSELYLPIGDAGILLAGSTTVGAFSDDTVTKGKLLASAIEAALEQVAREQTLRDREAELMRQNKRLEEFASVVSHDLRNPLNVAAGRLELAQEECDSEHLDKARHAHGRMDALIDDILTVAREGETVTEREQIDLDTFANSCWETVETGDASLIVETDRMIRGDKIRLKRVFENLFRNAIEHGGNEVRIRVGPLANGFFIEDDGDGIPEKEQDTVFDAGYSTSEGGTGFGLSIVKQIVEAHGWEIRLTNGPDGGARFEITGVEAISE